MNCSLMFLAHLTSRQCAGVNDLHQFRCDGAENQGLYCAIHTHSIWINDNVVINLNQDVVGRSTHILPRVLRNRAFPTWYSSSRRDRGRWGSRPWCWRQLPPGHGARWRRRVPGLPHMLGCLRHRAAPEWRRWRPRDGRDQCAPPRWQRFPGRWHEMAPWERRPWLEEKRTHARHEASCDC